MRRSQFFIPTLKEVPADAELVSHQLMLRAGLIRRLAAGIYTWLPLGLRVLRKVEQIVREEMEAIGAQELLMPAVQPAELWNETQRWDLYGNQLLKIQDRHERNFCFGPTHEEVITDLLRHELRSYKQLPSCFYQIQTKFRDEIRPRFGVMRSREFVMKDAYSFGLNQKDMETTYESMRAAYTRIFTRLGLTFRAVQADNGDIGGSGSQEFQVLAESGEDLIAYSNASDYAANIEKAEALAPQGDRPAPSKTMESVDTPNLKTIEEVCGHLNVPQEKSIKVLLVAGETDPVVALVLRGDHTFNPIKVEKHPAVASPLQWIDAETCQKATGCLPGSIGPVGLDLPMLVDRDAAHLSDFLCGANEEDKHLMNVNWDRDCALGEVVDLRNVVIGDASPDGQGTLELRRGIEVGHIFQLGDKYSQTMNAYVLDENGKKVFPQMGCYGIGVSRIVAAAIEQHHDKRGIIWPAPMAPFDVVLVPIQYHKSQRVRELCDRITADLESAGLRYLLDDRNERPGVLFADADLLGAPHRLVVGERGLDAGTLEYKARDQEEAEVLPLDGYLDRITGQN